MQQQPPTDNAKPVMPPSPTPNGGLYTGQPFEAGAPWRNFPATPDSGYLMHVSLRSARPPPGARFHLPGGGLRPGNNTPVLPVELLESTHKLTEINTMCVPDVDVSSPIDTAAEAAGFRTFTYLH